MKIIIVGGLHGDEPTGIAVAKYFQKHSYKNVLSIIAHPQAIAANKRYLETDLNRSFAPALEISLEEQLAKTLKDTIDGFDLLIDIHNTKADFTTCAITTMDPNVLHHSLAQHFNFKRIVVMPPSGSLISLNPSTSISLEIAHNDVNATTVKTLIDKIKLLSNETLEDAKLHTYHYVQSIKTETLCRLSITPSDITNFSPLSEEQKGLLTLPRHKKYVPIFAKKECKKDIAFELVEESL